MRKVTNKNTTTRATSTNVVVVSSFYLCSQLPLHQSRFLFFVLTCKKHNTISNCLEKETFEEKRLHLSCSFFRETNFVLRTMSEEAPANMGQQNPVEHEDKPDIQSGNPFFFHLYYSIFLVKI